MSNTNVRYAVRLSRRPNSDSTAYAELDEGDLGGKDVWVRLLHSGRWNDKKAALRTTRGVLEGKAQDILVSLISYNEDTKRELNATHYFGIEELDRALKDLM